jgi:hypothetical protein
MRCVRESSQQDQRTSCCAPPRCSRGAFPAVGQRKGPQAGAQGVVSACLEGSAAAADQRGCAAAAAAEVAGRLVGLPRAELERALNGWQQTARRGVRCGVRWSRAVRSAAGNLLLQTCWRRRREGDSASAARTPPLPWIRPRLAALRAGRRPTHHRGQHGWGLLLRRTRRRGRAHLGRRRRRRPQRGPPRGSPSARRWQNRRRPAMPRRSGPRTRTRSWKCLERLCRASQKLTRDAKTSIVLD